MGTLPALNCHWPPAALPAVGIVTVIARSSVRAVKLALIVAEPRVPAVPCWFVGDVLAASVYVAVPVRTSERYGGYPDGATIQCTLPGTATAEPGPARATEAPSQRPIVMRPSPRSTVVASRRVPPVIAGSIC